MTLGVTFIETYKDFTPVFTSHIIQTTNYQIYINIISIIYGLK